MREKYGSGGDSTSYLSPFEPQISSPRPKSDLRNGEGSVSRNHVITQQDSLLKIPPVTEKIPKEVNQVNDLKLSMNGVQTFRMIGDKVERKEIHIRSNRKKVPTARKSSNRDI